MKKRKYVYLLHGDGHGNNIIIFDGISQLLFVFIRQITTIIKIIAGFMKKCASHFL